jgi:cyclic pyranopterin phosphate synthase
MQKARLTHVDDRTGAVRMVDVSDKETTLRRAVASGTVIFSADAFRLLRANKLMKGDALAVARLAGIQAGKRTAEWIPLCHAVPLTRLDVAIALEPRGRRARITATVTARWMTGVEMEALTAVAAAALALYDMAKAVDRSIAIEEIVLLEKSGGRSGPWRRAGRRP